MDSSNKQRLIGVMVLIALATIVLPIVFHQSSHRNLALSIPQNAPPPPPLPDVQIAPPTQNTPITHKMSVPQFNESPVVSNTQTIDPTQPSAHKITAAPTPEVTPTAPVTNINKPQPTSKPAQATLPNKVINKAKAVVKKTASTLKHKRLSAKPSHHHAAKRKAIAHKTIAWDVQLGSFSDEKNAKNMVDKLRKNGFNAYTKIGSNPKGKATRVCIGPELQRETASSIVHKLESEMRVKAIVVKHPI